jgi:hypothetical protein
VIPSTRSLPELTADIRKARSDIETALITAVEKAIFAGKALIEAKAAVGHGNFEGYVTIECRFTLRTAQTYMKLAKYEPQLRQMLDAKAQGLSYLTMDSALKFIDCLRPKKKKLKPKPKADNDKA